MSHELEPYRHEIPQVDEAVYLKTREALEQRGFTIFPIEAKSIDQLRDDVLRREGGRFSWQLWERAGGMLDIVPPQMEVAFDPENLSIPESNNLSIIKQLEIIQEAEKALKETLPEDVAEVIAMRMLNASVYAQLDFAYQKQTTNPLDRLFPNFFARTIDTTVGPNAALVGRHYPFQNLDIGYEDRRIGNSYIFAVPVVVLPRKLNT